MVQDIKKLNPDAPIIITTAFNETDFFLRAIEIGVEKYVLKPIEAKKLAWLK